MNTTALTPRFSGQAIPSSLLNDLVNRQATGKLTVQNPFDELVTWQVYLGNGKIHFANSATGPEERLNYLIGSHLHQRKITLPPKINNDYDYLCELWKKEIFSFQETRAILTQFTQEALVQILSLPKTNCDFNKGEHLHHLFLNLDFQKSVTPLKQKIRYWWELRSEINSPFQRPLVENWDKFNRTLVKTELRGHNLLKRFRQCMENLDCLYGIASRTELSTLQLALLMRPLIKSGEIKMLSYQEIETDNRPLVVCVNDRPAMQRILQYTLDAGGFRSLQLEDPFKALSILLGQKPKAILLDAEMESISGYQLCSLCRKSGALNDVPIFILGEKNGISERIRAKLSGASSYISKPFLPNELLKLIDPSTNYAISA